MGIIRLRCSRETVVLSGVNTHHRGIAGCRPLCPAAYMRFRQHFSAYRWENQVACGMNYGDYPAAPRLPASTPHLRGRSPRLVQPGRSRSHRGRIQGKRAVALFGPCRGLGFHCPRRENEAGERPWSCHGKNQPQGCADAARGGARKRPAPCGVFGGHPWGKRRPRPARSKGPVDLPHGKGTG